MTGRRYGAVLLDAFGTLLDLDDPAGRLQRAVREQLGRPVSRAAARRAFAAEVAYYAERCHEGRDARTLARLHEACAAIVLDELGIEHDPADAIALLGHSISYRAFPDVEPTLAGLARAGVPVAVVSNADFTLPDMLRAAGLRLDRVFSSAATGSSKPDPGIFRAALDGLGVSPARALHVGDTPGADGEGARAAGVDVRIIDRSGAAAPGTIGSLTEILELIG